MCTLVAPFVRHPSAKFRQQHSPGANHFRTCTRTNNRNLYPYQRRKFANYKPCVINLLNLNMKTPNTMKKNNIMQEIWVQRKICTMNYFKYPDFVMINPINKREIEEQMMFTHAIIDGE